MGVLLVSRGLVAAGNGTWSGHRTVREAVGWPVLALYGLCLVSAGPVAGGLS